MVMLRLMHLALAERLPPCTPLRLNAGRCADGPSAGQPPSRYIRFVTALASASGADWSLKGEQVPVCHKSVFRDMRDLGYDRYGIPHVPVARQERLVLSVLLKEQHDKRKAVVTEAVARAMQVRPPPPSSVGMNKLHHSQWMTPLDVTPKHTFTSLTSPRCSQAAAPPVAAACCAAAQRQADTRTSVPAGAVPTVECGVPRGCRRAGAHAARLAQPHDDPRHQHRQLVLPHALPA